MLQLFSTIITLMWDTVHRITYTFVTYACSHRNPCCSRGIRIRVTLTDIHSRYSDTTVNHPIMLLVISVLQLLLLKQEGMLMLLRLQISTRVD